MAYQEILQVGSSYNRPVKTFYCDTVEEVANLPKNIPAGSVCECLTESGLRVFMLRKTSDSPEEGSWIEL